jgi:hypothetical protein
MARVRSCTRGHAAGVFRTYCSSKWGAALVIAVAPQDSWRPIPPVLVALIAVLPSKNRARRREARGSIASRMTSGFPPLLAVGLHSRRGLSKYTLDLTIRLRIASHKPTIEIEPALPSTRLSNRPRPNCKFVDHERPCFWRFMSAEPHLKSGSSFRPFNPFAARYPPHFAAARGVARCSRGDIPISIRVGPVVASGCAIGARDLQGHPPPQKRWRRLSFMAPFICGFDLTE